MNYTMTSRGVLDYIALPPNPISLGNYYVEFSI